MKKIVLLLLVCAGILTPAAARADDGGFWDMLFNWDPKFFGYGTDFHVLCLNQSGERVEGCEEWFRNLKHIFHPSRITHPFEFKDIKHEFDFKVSYMRSYGQRLSNPGPSDPNQDNMKRLNAWKLMGAYHYHFNSKWELGVGAGAIPIYGQDVTLFWRGIATPLSVIYSPGGALTIRADESYITGKITGAHLGLPLSAFANNGEWNFSLVVGFDLRRVGQFNVHK